jgi:hypothetical protein
VCEDVTGDIRETVINFLCIFVKLNDRLLP